MGFSTVPKIIMTEISAGELIDKITILQIKMERITDKIKLANIKMEYRVLTETRDTSINMTLELQELTQELRSVNQQLWLIEDDIRKCESKKDFGPEFIKLARRVYLTNDSRADLKRRINLILGSKLIEEKSYQVYTE